jgi:hypothetical protein
MLDKLLGLLDHKEKLGLKEKPVLLEQTALKDLLEQTALKDLLEQTD